MSGVNDQIKQQTLTRIAATRVRSVEAVTSVRNGVQGCVRTFPVSGAALKMAGVALGGLVLSGMLAGKLRRRRKVAKAVEPGPTGRTVALQALSALAIPLVQRWLTAQQNPATQGEDSHEQPRTERSGVRFGFPDLNAAFYRWLGLQK